MSARATFRVSPQEIALVNPNTGNAADIPTRADAEITLGVYRRHPVLIREAGGQNPWGLSFGTLFHMANDSGLFHQPDALADAEFDGWAYHRGGVEYLPLYEAKMLGHFDHRLSTYRDVHPAQSGHRAAASDRRAARRPGHGAARPLLGGPPRGDEGARRHEARA